MFYTSGVLYFEFFLLRVFYTSSVLYFGCFILRVFYTSGVLYCIEMSNVKSMLLYNQSTLTKRCDKMYILSEPKRQNKKLVNTPDGREKISLSQKH